MATKQDVERIKKLQEQIRKRAAERRSGAAPPSARGSTRQTTTTTTRQQTSSGAAPASASALPPEKPPAAIPTYTPLIDPSRASATDEDKGGAGKANVPDWLANIMKKQLPVEMSRLKKDEKLQWGDILPNVQEALKPMTRPLLTKEEREQEQGPQESFESMQQRMRAARQYARQNPFKFEPLPGLNVGGESQAPEAPGGIELLGAWLESGKTPIGKAVGGAIRGTPQAVMNIMNLTAQQAEQTIGVIEQALGVDVNPAQMMTGNFIPLVAQSGAEIARQLGMNDIAQEMDKHTQGQPNVVANLLANIVARRRMNGQDDGVARTLLDTVNSGQVNNVWGTAIGTVDVPDPEEIIARQTKLIETSQRLNEQGDAGIDEAWVGALYAYEGTEYMEEVTRRVMNGEDPDEVRNDIESRMTAQGRANDLVGQMVIDPLNALDAVGGVTGLLGMQSRSERAAANALSDFVAKSDEGAGLVRLAEQAGDVKVISRFEQQLRQMPIVGAILRPLPETIITRRAEEASSMVKMITQGISPNATEKLLAEGIDQHPKYLAVQAFLNHNSVDVAGTGKTAEQIQDLLGLGARSMTPEEMRILGAGQDAMVDMFRSNAADRARDWFSKMNDSQVQKLFDDYDEMADLYANAMKTRSITILDEAGNEVLVEGSDAIQVAENKLIDWLERTEEVYRKAADIQDPEGLYKGVTWARKKMQQIQGPFRFFHLSTNPGNMWRNITSNKMIGWMDGFNMLSPIKSTRAEIGRLGFSGPGLGRSLGGQSDIVSRLTGKQGGIKGLLGKVDPMEWSNKAESAASAQIYLQAAKRQLSRDWRVGKAIPEEEFYQMASYFGDMGDDVRKLIEGAWEPGELRRIAGRLTSDEPWKASAALSLAESHDDVLRSDLDEIIQAAGSREEAAQRIQDYVSAQQNQFQQLLDLDVVLEGTPDSMVLDAVQLAVSRLPEKERAAMMGDFTKTLLKHDATVNLHKSYMEQAYASMKGIGDDVLRQNGVAPPQGWETFREWIAERKGAFLERGEDVMPTFRELNVPVLENLKEGNVDAVREAGERWASNQSARLGTEVENPFRLSGNIDQAYSDYKLWAHEYWLEYRKSSVDEMNSIYNDVANAVEKAGQPRPPAVPEHMVEKFLPATQPEQRRMFAQLQAIARSRGIDTTVEMRDILQKAGVEHANRLFHKDIINAKWLEDATMAILAHSKEEGLAQKAVREAVDLEDDLVYILNKMDLDIDPTSFNQMQGKAAQMAERDAQIQAVLDALDLAPESRFVSDEAVQKLDEFIDFIEPRHVATRGIAEQVGTSARDFSLLNYSDNRGIDLLSGMLYNYPKWYMGTLKNMASRALQNPGRMAALMKFRQQLRNINRDLPEWYQDQINIKTPWGPMYFNVLATFDPMNGFLGDKFRDPDLYNDPLSATMAEAQQYGPGLHGLWASALAIRASYQGDPEAMMGWMSNLGPATRGVTAITALAKKFGGPGLDFIPPGGVVLEPWLWRTEEGHGKQMVGSKYDARRVGMAMGQMVENGQITPEQAYDAMLAQEGDLYDQALQISKENSSVSVLMSWLLGAGVKPRPGIEPQVRQMDLDRAALFAARDDGYYEGRPEAWRQAWEEMRENYPWMDFVQGFRRDQVGRSNIYAMSVYDRLPPNSKPYIEALMGGEAELYSDLLDKFYGSEPGQTPCSIENMTEPEQEMFMSMMKMMGATLSLPDDATASEWNMARQVRRGMYDQLNRQYEDIQTIQSQYFDILNSGDTNARANANQFLEQHGELQEYWDDKDRMVAADPLLSKYWASMELFERVSKDEFVAEMEAMYPGVRDEMNEYFRIKDYDPDAAKDFLASHPNIKAYWNAQTEWTMQLDDELLAMAEGIGNLEGTWGDLREDANVQNPGQQRVIDLIESGRRPMGDFELPEDMDARQVQAEIQNQLNQVQDWRNLYRQLRDMGNLDKTLTAFQEFASGSSKVDVVNQNLAEAKALLVALESINTNSSSLTIRTDSAGRRTKVTSRRYGGASSAPKSQQKAQNEQLNQQVDAFMASLAQQAPSYFGYLRNLAGYDAATLASFLESNPQFRQWLASVAGSYSLQTLLDYFKRMDAARAKRVSKKRGSGSKIISVRSSQPGL